MRKEDDFTAFLAQVDDLPINEGKNVVNLEALFALMEAKGWGTATLSRKLKIDYSYCYRVLKGQRIAGRKVIMALLALCQEYGLNINDYLTLPSSKK